jgi:hypothetical protein
VLIFREKSCIYIDAYNTRRRSSSLRFNQSPGCNALLGFLEQISDNHLHVSQDLNVLVEGIVLRAETIFRVKTQDL